MAPDTPPVRPGDSTGTLTVHPAAQSAGAAGGTADPGPAPAASTPPLTGGTAADGPDAAGAPPGPLPAAPPGYELLDLLGRGGMGVVYRARQVALNRTVALKVVLAGPHLAPEHRARFQAEAEAAASLPHPGVVQVHDYGSWEGRPYMALEFCPGGSLAGRLAGNPLPARDAAALVEAVARAVQAAHDGGVVHRDIKPANILLAADGTPKVADFGLAKLVDGGDGLTATGAVMGTPSYMAPEQATDAKAAGPPADVYALGAVLHECLTGRPPFRAETPLATLQEVLTRDPPRASALNRAVPEDLDSVCRKCLEKAAGDRYPTAGALADDLARFLRGEPVRARPLDEDERLGRLAAGLGFRDLSPVGCGAVCRVYKARQPRMNRWVALKVFDPVDGDADEWARRFQVETELLGSLSHPNIVQVYDTGEVGGAPYLCMEYMGGGSLRGRLAGGPLAPAAAAELVRALAGACHYAHGLGVVHGGLRPGSVLLSEAGTPKLSDFDRPLAERGGRLPRVQGTSHYRAPEQVADPHARVGPATDVYGLGVVLYVCLTTEPPAPDEQLLGDASRPAHAGPAPPSAKNPGVPRDLDAVCRKCLRFDPADRYPTAAALADDLKAVLEGRPTAAAPVGALSRLWKRLRGR